MKKLILKMSISLDGFVAGPNGQSEWIFKTDSPDSMQWSIASLWRAGMHLMGSRTYQDMAAWWPTSKESFAPVMNELPKAVFSRRGVRPPDKKLTTASLKDARAANPGQQGAKASAAVWDSWRHPKIFTGNLTTAIKRLKQGRGKPLVAHGGAGFARSLIATGLVDEYQLLVHPIVLGGGLPIFCDLKHPLYLKLVKSIPFRKGAIMQIYRPRKRPA
jgi:dihydrofolate reductase